MHPRLCWFFQRGSCAKGDVCNFSHNITDPATPFSAGAPLSYPALGPVPNTFTRQIFPGSTGDCLSTFPYGVKPLTAPAWVQAPAPGYAIWYSVPGTIGRHNVASLSSGLPIYSHEFRYQSEIAAPTSCCSLSNTGSLPNTAARPTSSPSPLSHWAAVTPFTPGHNSYIPMNRYMSAIQMQRPQDWHTAYPCRHYFRGDCRNGNRCRFSHSNQTQESHDQKIDNTNKEVRVSSQSRHGV